MKWLLTTARLANPAENVKIRLSKLIDDVFLIDFTCFLFQVIKWCSVDLLEPVPMTSKEEIWEVTVKQDWHFGKQLKHWNAY